MGVWEASQLKSGDGLYGLEPSGAVRSIEPGQRLLRPIFTPALSRALRSSGGTGRAFSAGPSVKPLSSRPARE
jgi:hypothetical protein